MRTFDQRITERCEATPRFACRYCTEEMLNDLSEAVERLEERAVNQAKETIQLGESILLTNEAVNALNDKVERLEKKVEFIMEHKFSHTTNTIDIYKLKDLYQSTQDHE